MDLRPLGPRDADRLWHWRVQDEKQPHYRGRATDRRGHGRWVRDRIKNPAVKIWICYEDSIPVGVLRVDSNGELTVTVDESFRGRGYSAKIIDQAKRYSGWHRLKASVDYDNSAAAQMLKVNGFVHQPDVDFYLWQR